MECGIENHSVRCREGHLGEGDFCRNLEERGEIKLYLQEEEQEMHECEC